jgi:hypothetical protein
VHWIFLDVLTLKLEQSQQFYNKRSRVLDVMMVKLLCFIQQHSRLCRLDGLENELVVESAEKKLATFAPICKTLLLHCFEVLPEVEGREQIHVLMLEYPSVQFRGVGSHSITERCQSIGQPPVKMTLPVGNPPRDVLLGDLLIDFKRTSPLVVVRS